MGHSEQSFQPTEAWPLQEAYKRRLHEDIQQWGEILLPALVESEGVNDDRKTAFFLFLMDAVPRGDSGTARLIKSFIAQAYESTRSYYTGKVGDPSDSYLRQQYLADFEALYHIYTAGIETTV
jgi:hypothetical protein